MKFWLINGEMYFIEKSISDDEYYNYCEIIKEKSKISQKGVDKLVDL